jgi:hypothetical protein
MVALTADGSLWEKMPRIVLTITLTYNGVTPEGTASTVLWLVPYPPATSLNIGKLFNANGVADAPTTKPIVHISVVQLTWIVDESVKLADIVRPCAIRLTRASGPGRNAL